MSERVREQLLGYLLDALDDSEAESVMVRLQRSPHARQELTSLRRQLDRIEAAQPDYSPPPGLARRTCEFVFGHARRAVLRATPPPPMTPQSVPPHWAGRIGWLDVGVAVTVLVLAGFVLLPAVYNSRFQARLAACRDNLRYLGVSLTGYSQQHEGRFPRVPAEGKLAAAGVYAPTLVSAGYLTETQRVICPESALAAQPDVRIPSLEELQAATSQRAAQLRQRMGGSYGYCLGYLDHGVVQPTKDLGRAYFALMADAPSDNLPNHQSANHGGRGQCVLFEDGHSEFLTSTRLDGSDDDIFANDDQLVAVGVHRDDSVIAPSGTPPIVYVNHQSAAPHF
jgi:hypothetical protein